MWQKKETPIWEKTHLTLEEASAYFNIGVHTIRRLVHTDNHSFAVYLGRKPYIKRIEFEKYLEKKREI